MKHLILLLIIIATFAGCNKEEDDSDRTPTKLYITKITVTRFPQYNGGSEWDFLDGGPDIFPVVYLGSGTASYNAAVQNVQSASAANEYSFTPPSGGILIENFNSINIIELYDYDGTSANDFMGSVSFQTSAHIGGNPATFEVDGGGAVAFRLDVDYVF